MGSDGPGAVDTTVRTWAVGYLHPGPLNDRGALLDVEVEVPEPVGHDLLVEIRAVSVNPVDVKVRASTDPDGTPKVLGYDGAGVVVGVGSLVSLFAPGDEVFYAGSIARPGTNAGLHLVDERIVGHKPRTLDFAEAAALPLTTITAWETLFDRLALGRDSRGTLLVMAAAGGVGSMVCQLARQLTDLTVIGTASRSESAEWARAMGAHQVVDHHHLVEEVHGVAPDGLDFVFTPYSAGNVESFAALLKPRGAVVAIDDPKGLDVRPLKSKSQTWHWEYMFTRPVNEPDSTYQHQLLEQVARLVDAGTLRTTLTTRLSPIGAETLSEAHRQVEASATIGKVVVADPPGN
jgi:NADPH:quinone reductase